MTELLVLYREALANKETDGIINRLRDALTNKDVLHAPWTSGVFALSEHEITLFYERKDGTSSSLKLGSTTVAQAEDLSNACQPATFGLNQQDVLDETYRKAGKLDAGKFAWLFNPPNHEDFVSKLASGLFPWNSPDEGIRFELYKLNVYGEGSFFKAHQDTPRSENMFGSLVVLLPFTHQGGNLLRHRGREFEFDGQAFLKDAPTPAAAYVAFFSDVEHEVARVTSGHRVTITYNLYFDSSNGPPVTRVPADAQLEHPFKTVLKDILRDPIMGLVHPWLGFGLQHAYPFKSAILNPKSLKLKGSDATLIKTFTELGIQHRFFLLYRKGKDGGGCPFRVLSTTIVDGNVDHDTSDPDLEQVTSGRVSFLVWDEDPEEVAKHPPQRSGWYNSYLENEEQYNRIDVEWVIEPNEEHLDRSVKIAYGNESSLQYFYHQLCVVAVMIKEAPGEVGGHASQEAEGDTLEENEEVEEDEDE